LKDSFIPFASPSIGEEEIAEVVDSLRSGWLTTGPKAKRFEEDFSKAVGAPYAMAVNSGTAAMHLSLEAIGLSEGDYVLTTPYAFTATAEVIRYFNAHPLFTDVDPDTGNIDPTKAGAAIGKAMAEGKKVRAILPVHFAGRACPMDELLALSRKYLLKIVEDAAHAFPCGWGKQTVGTIGDLTCFSFYVTKPIATGEGGMVTTADEEYARRIRIMRLHGISRDIWDRSSSESPNWRYEVIAPGYKYNMTDIAASIGIHQLRKAEIFRSRREAIAKRYDEGFRGLPVRLPSEKELPPGSTHSWHLYVLRLNAEQLRITRDRFIELLAERGIGASVHFIPLHLHPYWRDRYRLKPEDFPMALDLYRRCVSLPIYPGLSDEQVERVVNAVKGILAENSR